MNYTVFCNTEYHYGRKNVKPSIEIECMLFCLIILLIDNYSHNSIYTSQFDIVALVLT